MAKNDRYSADQGRVKFRVIEFEVDGANSTLVEGIRNLAAAISRGNGSNQSTTRQLQTVQEVRTPNRALDGETEDASTTIEIEQPQVRKPVAPRKKTSVKPVAGIDWKIPVPSLADFVSEFDLNSTIRKYVAILAWFKQHRSLPVVTIDHIYSAYKTMGWTDLPQFPLDPIRDLKNKAQYKWVESTAKGQYELNAYGEQELEKWKS